MKEDIEIMKKNKFTKILMYSIFSCLIAISIFLMISYFGKEEEVQKNNSSDIRINQEQTEQVKDSKENQKNNNEQDKGDENSATVVQESKENQNTNIKQNKNSVNEFQTTNQQKDYKGKRLSISEGLGTTGKVFKSQKEALEFGKQEIKRLAEGDKKSRQFSISKVTAEDGSLVGWTVDVFEDNSVEKVVSNPIENITENNKDKDKEKNKE